MNERFTGDFDKFLASVRPDGNYAIIATQRLGIEWAAAHVLDSEPGVKVNWGRGTVEWPSGARGVLLVATSDHSLQSLRSRRFDAALLLYGDPERPFPPALHSFLAERAVGPEFKVWNASW